ncbi:chemotaxis protein CheW [Desulfosporosinus sp. FKA]|uniref:chemotaxis protein CheW n=1 Tax=Desulfosporosinus sp. FKA TaxID=1969834 RepID=UPI000B49C37A|nr:chemotaxis protein CheW [Desulfosporosinus sp. FKA]
MAINQLVIFALDGEEYGVDVTTVNGILRSSKFKIQTVPGLPYAIEGIINLRGRVNYIFNLRKKFNLTVNEYPEDSKFVMLNINGTIAGCIVDEVTDIVKFNEDDIQPAPEFVSQNNGYLKGIAKINDRMVIFLDPEKLLATEEYNLLEVAD